MLRRLMDPATSTRRTEAARSRLAEHPVTAALLDAGVRLLVAEFAAPPLPADTGPGAAHRGTAGQKDDEPAARLFSALTASRVCAAATRLGPLRTTEGHLRDRWPLHDDFASDLIAYGLWELHWADMLGASNDLVPGEGFPAPPGGLPEIAAGLAELNLYDGRTAVTHRLELLMATMAGSRPGLRHRRRQGFAHVDASGSATFAAMFEQVGLRLRPGCAHGELTVAFGALAEGANLRLVARRDSPQARTAGLRTIAVGGEVLAHRYWSDEPLHDDDVEVRVPRPRPAPPPLLGEVLERLTDPARAVRRTEEGRQRLASDPITLQLLDGGLAVLAEEFDLAGRPGGSRIFDVLSVARVVAEARSGGGAGASATVAQLRDRWVVQEHYVDDLVSHALRRRTSVVDALVAAADREGGLLGERSTGAAVAEHLRRVQEEDAARLRLLVTTLAAARPGVSEQLVVLDDREQQALAELVEQQVDVHGLQLLPTVDVHELAGWLLALSDGVQIRLLATGGAPDAVGDGSLLARTGLELVRGCCRPRTAGRA